MLHSYEFHSYEQPVTGTHVDVNAALIHARQAGTRFTYPGGVEGRVDSHQDWLHTEMVYLPTDGHPSRY